ncbi:hypothetical protein LCGC14_2271100 [marine sediment metagenome]|uniref:Uncharacterized protein n=1 Tax=marine sediment metagenome TaxID=412755 RepID=A0A0F9CWY2_9ZZZZ
MSRRHAARPRLVLVVDNRSSSDNSIPPSRAKRNKTKCHLAGIPPRNRHIETVFDRTPGKSCAKADGPPNREITSVISLMGNSDITNCNAPQASKCDAANFRVLSQSVSMSKSTDQKEKAAARQKEKAAARIKAAALNRAAAERVAYLEKRSGDNRKTFAKRMGLDYGAYKNALGRKRFTGASLMSLALSLEASLDYVAALTNEAAPLNRPNKPKTFWEMKG